MCVQYRCDIVYCSIRGQPSAQVRRCGAGGLQGRCARSFPKGGALRPGLALAVLVIRTRAVALLT